MAVADLVVPHGEGRSHGSVADRIRSDFVSRWDLICLAFCFVDSSTFSKSNGTAKKKILVFVKTGLVSIDLSNIYRKRDLEQIAGEWLVPNRMQIRQFMTEYEI